MLIQTRIAVTLHQTQTLPPSRRDRLLQTVQRRQELRDVVAADGRLQAAMDEAVAARGQIAQAVGTVEAEMTLASENLHRKSRVRGDLPAATDGGA
jgi:hypothetical protein